MRILRKFGVLAGLLGFVAALVWLDSDKEFKKRIFPHNSLHNTAEYGCSQAFRYLKETRGAGAPPVRELNRQVEFAILEADAVILRFAPKIKPGEREDPTPRRTAPVGKPAKPATPMSDKPLLSPGELAFVQGGGRLVLALEKHYGPIEVIYQRLAEPFEKTYPIWPGVSVIRPTASRTLKSEALSGAHTIFTLNGEVYAARLPLGKGEVIALGSAQPFTNSHVDDADNLKLLQALAPSTRAVYFDEFVHEMQSVPSTVELLQRWGLGAALLVLAVYALIYLWRARTPIGAPEDDHKEVRTQAIDFVGSLAPLYNRALAPHQALALHYRNFVHAVSVQSGLRGEDLAERIRTLLDKKDVAVFAGQRPLAAGEFEARLSDLNRAFGRLERAHRR